MIEAYRIGAIFTVQNEASAVLQQIARELWALNTELTKVREALQGLVPRGLGRRMEGVVTGLTAIAGEAGKVGTAFGGAATEIDAAMGKVDGSVSTTIDRVAALKTEITSLSTQMREMSAMSVGVPQISGPSGGGRASLGDRQGGGHGGDGGVHFSRMSAPIPGAGHVSIGGNTALAALGLFGYGVYEEAEVEDQVARIMATSQLPLGKGMMDTPQAQMIRKAIQDGAVATRFSAKDVGEAMLGTEREFQGLDFNKRMEVLSTLMPYAGAEARLKETGLKESFETLVGLMHMSGGFKPEELPELARAFSFTSMTTLSSLPQFRNALSYSMPTLHAGLGMDPSTVMFLTAMMQTAGITNTKSGTWLRNFFTKAEPDTEALGPLKKDQVQHNEALHRLGILDDGGKSTWKVSGADGKVDWMQSVIKLSETLNQNLAKLPTDDRLQILHKAFGAQGEGFATLMQMNSFVEQMPLIAQKMKSFQGGADVLGPYRDASAVQQALEAWRDTQNILMDIGKQALPTVNAALKEFDELLKVENPIAKLSTDLRNWIKGGVLGILNGPADNASPGRHHGLLSVPKDPNAMPVLPGAGGTYGGSAALPMAFVTGPANDNDAGVQTIRRGVLLAFQDYASGGAAAAGGGSGGLINAAYTTFGSGGGTAGYAGFGDSFSGSIGDGSAVDRALGLKGAREGDAARALGHVMHAGEWCADFVNAIIEKSGGHGTGNAMARSFMHWGHAVGLAQVMKGDVAVLNGGGHVGLFTGVHGPGGSLEVVAGNTRDGHGGHEVRRYMVSPSGIFGARRGGSFVPPAQKPGATPIHVPIHLDGKIVAEVVTHHQHMANRFSSNPHYHDDARHYAAPDVVFG